MKKQFLIGYLILTIACQIATSTPITGGLSTPIAVTPTTRPLENASATVASPPPPAHIFTPTLIPLYFIEEFNTDLEAWSSFLTGGTDSPSVNLENDFLRVDFSSPNTWYYAIHNAHEYSKVYVSAKFSGTPSGSVGVICDYSESKGWYEFNLASDRVYSVLFGQWLTQGIAQYTPIATATTEYLQTGKLNYEIGLTCDEEFLLLHINGKLFRKLNVSRYGLTEGRIGITASSFEETPMVTTIDWVKVNEPSQ